MSAKTSAPHSPPVTLAQIASEANLSRSGVSRALRNDPSIPESTCRRVQQIAERLGFIIDARISHAYSLIRMRGDTAFRGTLGFLNAYPVRAHWPEFPAWYFTSLYESARTRAEELSYRLDELSISDPRLTPNRIHGILEARGIQGILVPPLPDGVHALPIDWNRFASVAITHSLTEPILHRVTPNQYQNMLIALKGLKERGYRRIGLMTTKDFSLRVNDTYLGAYFAFQYRVFPQTSLPILDAEGDPEKEFDQWFEMNRPDAIVGILPGYVKILDRRGLLEGDSSIGFVSLGGAFDEPRHRLHQKVSYICQNASDVARSGIDLLIAQIERREQGVPDVANFVQISGQWMDKSTTPNRNNSGSDRKKPGSVRKKTIRRTTKRGVT